MVSLEALWLPIVVSSALVFVASAVIWMVLPIHKGDYKKLGANEDGMLQTVRSMGLRPGMYMFPCCDPAAVKDNPAAMEKLKAGPWGTVTVLGGMPNMGVCLFMWAVNLLVVSTLIAYVSSHVLHTGDAYLKVFRVTATMAVLAYGGNILTDSIWKGRPWSLLPGSVFDAAVYAGLTAGTFSWLWPKVAALPG